MLEGCHCKRSSLIEPIMSNHTAMQVTISVRRDPPVDGMEVDEGSPNGYLSGSQPQSQSGGRRRQKHPGDPHSYPVSAVLHRRPDVGPCLLQYQWRCDIL